MGLTAGQENLLLIVVLGGVCAAAYGWFSDKSRKIKENELNRNLRAELEDRQREFTLQTHQKTRELTVRESHISDLQRHFEHGFLPGRNWLAKYIAEADRVLDDSISGHLRHKKRPAIKAAEEVAEARRERRDYKERVKFLELQLQSYKEYFPFLEEYEDVILDESVPLLAGELNLEELENSDPVLKFMPKSKYLGLTPAKRNQAALSRYLSGNLGPAAIGRLYERYLGYLYETAGWKVEYFGIVKGFEDLGRDLICTKGNEVKIIQAKCWSAQKTIHEKHVFQLYGTTQMYLMDRSSSGLFTPTVTASFITTTSLSPVARKAAEWLEIEIKEQHALDKTFPMIKCNVNQRTKDKIYHLPFDQQYDKTVIATELGEAYVTTVEEAESKGFRRAFRFSGT